MGNGEPRNSVRDDLAEIASFIAADNWEAALRVYHAIEDAFRFLAGAPGAGALCESQDLEFADVRFWPVKKYRNYLVIYRPFPDGAEIIRVIHAARDVNRILR